MNKLLIIGAVVAAIAVSVFWTRSERSPMAQQPEIPTTSVLPAVSTDGRYGFATFAGGCFWCVEADFEKVPGVVDAVSGYTGGERADPSYEEVARGATRHLESVLVRYDPRVVSYEALLQAFWRMIDPTDEQGQFVDRGHQYSTAVFVHDETQRGLAEASREQLAAGGRFERPVITPVLPAKVFYPAEDYHQDYHARNPLRYGFYRSNSGRDSFLSKTWGDDLKVDYAAYASTLTPRGFDKPPAEELQRTLTPMQFKVTQQDGTEPPYDNAYWNEKRDGLYVDVVSGEPLFSSRDKFDSGTGWPSFSRPVDASVIVERTDYKLLLPRIEVRSRDADSHLGHVFEDGPAPTGLRYCINSAALRFIPKSALVAEGYGDYAPLFDAE